MLVTPLCLIINIDKYTHLLSVRLFMFVATQLHVSAHYRTIQTLSKHFFKTANVHTKYVLHLFCEIKKMLNS
jgi:hypothetical protein